MASFSLKLSVHLALALLAAVQFVGCFHHHPLHCPKWKNNCIQYEQNCHNLTSRRHVWKSCHEIVSNASDAPLPSGIYSLQRNGPFSTEQAFCDTESAGGGWTVILRRTDNMTDFDRTLQEYIDGFGDLSGNFWYGLKAMHEITLVGKWELRVDLADANNNSYYVNYGMFSVETPNYKLMLGDKKDWPESTANDSLLDFSGQLFSAKGATESTDNSNDCISKNMAGWWYVDDTCKGSRGAVLTGKYGSQSMRWYSYNKAAYIFYDKIEMKIRPQKSQSI